MSRKRKEIDTSTYQGRFAIHLRELREERKMTVDELATRSGIPRRTLFNWESATSKPQIDDCLLDLVDALGVQINNLLPIK